MFQFCEQYIDFDKKWIKSIDCFGYYGYFKILILTIHEHDIYFHFSIIFKFLQSFFFFFLKGKNLLSSTLEFYRHAQREKKKAKGGKIYNEKTN